MTSWICGILAVTLFHLLTVQGYSGRPISRKDR
jgi:hypothetical protein